MRGSNLQKALGQKKTVEDGPIFVLNLDTRIVNIFPVSPTDRSAVEDQGHETFLFGTVTEGGTVNLYKYLKHRTYWRLYSLKTDVDQVTYGSILEGPSALLIIQSRTSGIHVFPFKDGLTNPRIAPPIKLLYDLHVGFCKMVMTSSLTVIPVMETFVSVLLTHQLSLLSSGCKTPLPSCSVDAGCIVMFVTLIKTGEEGETLVLYGVEDGTVKVSSFFLLSGDIDEGNLVEWERGVVQLDSPSLTNKDCKADLTPICAAYSKTTRLVVVGTTVKTIFLLQLDPPSRTLALQGKRTLLNKGINCVELHSEEKLLVSGGWDGFIRLFSFPSMNQITSIRYFKSAITSLLFFKKFQDQTLKKYFLLCGSQEGQVGCWDLESKLIKGQVHENPAGV